MPALGDTLPEAGQAIAFKEMEMTDGGPAFSDWKEALVAECDASANVVRIRYEPWCTPEPLGQDDEEDWQRMTLGSDVQYDPELGKVMDIMSLMDVRVVQR